MGNKVSMLRQGSTPGARMDDPVSPEEELMLFHPRKRRLSDSSLQVILHEPVVADAFRNFMFDLFSEEVVSLWLDLYSYELIPYEAASKHQRAQEIYLKYFSEHALFPAIKDLIDTDTLNGLSRNLMIDKDEIVRQRNPRVLSEVFKFIYGKVVTILKFDYVPQFLVSKQFSDLELSSDGSPALGDHQTQQAPPPPPPPLLSPDGPPLVLEQHEPEKAQDFATIEKVLTNPCSCSFLLDFIHSEQLRGVYENKQTSFKSNGSSSSRSLSIRHLMSPLSSPRKKSNANAAQQQQQQQQHEQQNEDERIKILKSAGELVELFFEIEDFRGSHVEDKKHQFDRLQRVFTRYGPENSAIQPPIEYLAKHFGLFEAKVARYHELIYRKDSRDFLDPIREEILTRLEKHVLPLFQNSSLFTQMASRLHNVTRQERERRALDKLNAFVSQRNFMHQNQYDFTLESCLQLPWGAYYLKRYARKRLQEESVLFVLEAQAYREMNEHNLKLTEPLAAMLVRERAKRIMEMYVLESAPLEVNISHQQRSDIVQSVEVGNYCTDLFETARKEIMQVLSLNLWPLFIQNPMHDNVIRKCSHNMHRSFSTPAKAHTNTDTSTAARPKSLPVHLHVSTDAQTNFDKQELQDPSPCNTELTQLDDDDQVLEEEEEGHEATSPPVPPPLLVVNNNQQQH